MKDLWDAGKLHLQDLTLEKERHLEQFNSTCKAFRPLTPDLPANVAKFSRLVPSIEARLPMRSVATRKSCSLSALFTIEYLRKKRSDDHAHQITCIVQILRNG